MNVLKITFVAVSVFLFGPVAFAFDIVGVGKITNIENGWFGEGIAIKHSGPGIAGCSELGNFAIDKNHPSYRELVAMALAAQASAADVDLVVEKGVCLFGNRTKVLAIRLGR